VHCARAGFADFPYEYPKGGIGKGHRNDIDFGKFQRHWVHADHHVGNSMMTSIFVTPTR